MSEDSGLSPSTWSAWRAVTPARIALGRAGNGMPTDETLRFGLAHAMARDAVGTALDVDALAATLAGDGWRTVRVRSQASDRATYLRRPDLGRRIDPDDAARLATGLTAAVPPAAVAAAAAPATGKPAVDLCLVIGDGLSSLAVARHAAPLLAALKPLLPANVSLAPIIIATQARVALADDIGAIAGARLVAILLGERPGLSSPDSLGIYLTFDPRRGRSDAERNCISNVRPEGLGYRDAAARLAWLIDAALQRGLTGIALKDDSGGAAPSRIG